MRTCLDGRPPPSAIERINDPKALLPAAQVHGDRYPRWLLEAIDWAMALAPLDRPQAASELRDVLLAHSKEVLAEWGDSQTSSSLSQRDRSDLSDF
jgi:hypothetical protein